MSFDHDNRDRDLVENEDSPWQEYDGPEPSTADSTDLHLRSPSLSDVEDARFPLPVWMQESSKSFNWKWVPLPIRKLARSVATWSEGPDPPRIQKIAPFFPIVQEAPVKLLDKLLRKKAYKASLLVFTFLCWSLILSLVLRHQAKSGNIGDYGQPQSIWCGASYWYVLPMDHENSR